MNTVHFAYQTILASRELHQSAWHLCVGEVSFKKGYQYVTVISDTQRLNSGMTVALRVSPVISGTFGYRQVESIKTLLMNMSSAYIHRQPGTIFPT